MGIEMKALYDNDTWDLVSQPSNTTATGSKYEFLKLKSNGENDYKGRPAVQEYKPLIMKKHLLDRQNDHHLCHYCPLCY